MVRGDEIIQTERNWIEDWIGGGSRLRACRRGGAVHTALRLISSALRLITSVHQTVVKLLIRARLGASDVSSDFAS